VKHSSKSAKMPIRHTKGKGTKMDVKTLITNWKTMTQADREVHCNLKEAKLSRVHKHVTNIKGSFGVISAWLTDGADKLSDKENVKRAKRLATEARKAGFGYVWLEGYWVADKGTPDEKQVKEYSIFVVGNPGDSKKLESFLAEMGKKYKQEAWLFRAEGDKKVYAIDKSGGKYDIGGWKPDKVADMFSRLATGKNKGRPFVFEDHCLVGRIPMEAMVIRAALRQLYGHKTATLEAFIAY